MRYAGIVVLLLLLLLFLNAQQTQIINHRPSTTFERETLKVMSFNIRGGRDTISNRPHLKAVAKEIQHSSPDIVALQEVDVRLPRSHFKNQAAELARSLSMNAIFSPSMNFLIGSYGNAVLSRYPIMDYQSIPLPGGGEKRSMLKAVLDLGPTHVQVFNTHLSLRAETRKKQIRFIGSLIRLAEHPTILVGDLNMLAHDPLLDHLRTELTDPLYERRATLPTLAAQRKTQSSQQTDYIFLSRHFDFQQAASQPSRISDHAAVTYAIRFTESTSYGVISRAVRGKSNSSPYPRK